ncbi:7-cyano-7-deazaguanine synthase [Streptomyces sp. INA 01156]
MHSTHGQQVLEHFLYRGAGLSPSWTTGSVIEDQVAVIREQVGDRRAICGLSGGVDSAVAAALVQKAIGAQLTCVYVDHGLMRKGETEQVEKDFVAATGVQLKVVDASERFLTALKGVSDPRRSGRSSAASSSGSSSRPRPRSSRTRARPWSSWSRAPSTRTSWSPAGAPAPPTSSPTTTWAACPRTSSSS